MSTFMQLRGNSLPFLPHNFASILNMIMHTPLNSFISTNTKLSIAIEAHFSPSNLTKNLKRKREKQLNISMRKQESSECSLPRYIGVRKRKWGRWVSEIREPGKKTRIWLGSFDTPEMAAAAYDVAAWYLKGSDARINFPELVESLPKPASADADDVRRAAQEAALQLRVGRQDNGDGDSGRGSVLARVQLSPSDIQAINEVPLDSPKMWMELGGPSTEGEPVNFGEIEMDEWDDMDTYPIWD